jgi:hypothetical protein
MRVLALATFLSLSLMGWAPAQNATLVRTGSSATISVVRPPDGPAVIEVRTDPQRTGHQELFLWLMPREVGRSAAVSRVVPPVEPGLYRYAHDFSPGEWHVTLRHGVGLDLYYTSIQFRVTSEGVDPAAFRRRFQPDLAESAPRYLQPMGFGILGLVVALTLALLVITLRRLKTGLASGV